MSIVSTLLVAAPVLIPGIGAAVFAGRGWRPAGARIGAVAAGGILASGCALAVLVSGGGAHTAIGGLLRVDAVSAFMVIVIGAVALLATLAAPAYLAAELAAERITGRTARRQCVLVQLFLAAMALPC